MHPLMRISAQATAPSPDADRLRALRSLPCPSCRPVTQPLAWDGSALSCTAGHRWTSASALMADVRVAHGISLRAGHQPGGQVGVPRRPAVVHPRQAVEYDRAERRQHQEFQDALFAAVGGWVPPEAML